MIRDLPAAAGMTPRAAGLPSAKNDADGIKKAAREMESLFLFELLKVMRESTAGSADSGLGQSTYLSMFDMELARVISTRGTGLQDMIVRALSKGEAGVAAPSATLQDLAPARHVSRVPLVPEAGGWISSGFGMRRDPVSGELRLHEGIDIAIPEGTDVHPLGQGTVVFSGERAGFGNVVEIDHGGGYTTRYAHTSENLVKEGDAVTRDTVIARSGNTGRSTGPHVHLEVRFRGEAMDPGPLLERKRG
jgi:murein DD-endopeptidase MepM/ murein hydrolase activator NlpD